ncbi:MAG: Asp-tRNA(Asn)/Glu-tRNA(Gln) amidotransferase subunit GatB [Oscillospiraceae bacterium]|nr:Asp-tRNA(Asn)/Glu-tRNA(Gln) amidotransferase subunit GatB [Oscillospiraceae bacterium]
MEWEIVMGLEVHVELATKTKIFCACTTEFGGAPNTHCCPVCTGMPGTLPVLNRQVVEYAVRAGLALNCGINQYNKFDRKNYFYPDLPKAYQISQLYLPFAHDGHVDLKTKSGRDVTIRIHEIHMEEDAGKLVHSLFGDTTYPDYNRCGVPLIEIVSEPDFRETEEVIAYLNKLKSTFEYLGISDCKMEEGSMRADVNLSVRPKGAAEFGTRTEMKNINSLKAIERAIAYESKRQIALIEAGERVVQETRRWDENKEKTFAMRSKENAQDYRYFPEPDIPPVSITDEEIAHYIEICPEFADAKADRYVAELGLAREDAQIIAGSKYLAKLFEETNAAVNDPAEVRYWMMTQIMYFMNERGVQPEKITLDPAQFAKFIEIVKAGRINRQIGKQVFEAMFFAEGAFDVEQYIKEHDLEQVDDKSLIEETVAAVIAANPKAVEQYRSGQTKITGFFVGQTMKQLKGKANPATVNAVLAEALKKL